jgi:hypothetical protein
MQSESRYYRINPVVSCGAEKEGAILFNPDTDNTSIINDSGHLIWDFLQHPHTVEEICSHLLENYQGLSTEQANKDVTQFVNALMPDFLEEVGDHE